jgi:hypothetical protein
LLLLVAEGTEYIRAKLNGEASFVALCFIGLLFLHPLLYSTYHLLTPRVREEIKPVMNYVKEHQHGEDVVYVYHDAIPAFQYYGPRFGLDRLNVVMGVGGKDDWGRHEKDIELLRNNRRVWLLFSHSRSAEGYDEEKVFLYLSNKRATKLASFKSAGAAVYLYRFDGLSDRT